MIQGGFWYRADYVTGGLWYRRIIIQGGLWYRREMLLGRILLLGRIMLGREMLSTPKRDLTMKQSVEFSSSRATLSINGSLKTFHCALGFSYSLYCYYFVPLLRNLKFGQVLHPRALKYSGIYPGLSSSPFHCYNYVVRKSKACYAINSDF